MVAFLRQAVALGREIGPFGGQRFDLGEGLIELGLRRRESLDRLADGLGLVPGLAQVKQPEQDDAAERAAKYVHHGQVEDRRDAVTSLHGMAPLFLVGGEDAEGRLARGRRRRGAGGGQEDRQIEVSGGQFPAVQSD